MKKCFVKLLVFIFCVLLSGCSNYPPSKNLIAPVKADTVEIEDTLKEIINTYNTNNIKKINSMLDKYINAKLFAAMFRGDGANSISIENSTISLPDQAFKNFALSIDDYTIDISGNTAVIMGYVSGRVSLTKRDFLEGPWRMDSLLFKNDNRWYIEHLSLKKFDIPKLEYYLQLPEVYGKESNKKWPLIVFLHGSGEVGANLDAIKEMPHSIPKIAAATKDFPFAAVSPLCPKGHSWLDLTYSVNNMIDEMLQKYSIDPDRIYLTGLSLGGYGTWGIARQYPNRFAAIAPVCGTLNPDSANKLKNIPIWAFHGDSDPIVSIDDEKKAVDVIDASGGDIKYTVYPGMGHEIWNKAYNTPELYEWFLRHKRKGK